MAHDSTLIDILAPVLGSLFSFWVFFPLIALRNVLGGRGKLRGQLRKIPRNLLLFWCLFAFLRLVLFIRPTPALVTFVLEPLSTYLFLAAGVACLVWWRVVERRGAAPAPIRPAVQTAPVAAVATVGSAVAAVPLCPKCSVPMVVRVARQGARAGQRFYGCPNFPACRETQAL